MTIDRSRARFLADPAALWRNAYAEAGRIMRHDFWVADMADVDWDAVLDAYRPLLDRIAGPADFADLLWEMFGELGTSHAYVRPPRAHDDTPREAPVGLLGADLERGADGRWPVTRVLPGESSDPRARSPLAAPGVQIGPGDVLLAVDGQLRGRGRAWPAAGRRGGQAGRADRRPGRGRRARSARRGHARRRPPAALPGLGRRAPRQRVRELSGGRIGYLHVPDMVSEGWADFHRDLRAEMIREALIVDVRGNRGGHTSQLVVEKLARRVIGWDVPRGMQPTTYPQDAPRGPVVALTDEYAGSDGDIVTAAIKILGLGPVVGTRTWGGVIGIDGPCTSSSTAPRSPCRGTRPGSTVSAGGWRTTASTRTSRS